jgi:hypothetical protein
MLFRVNDGQTFSLNVIRIFTFRSSRRICGVDVRLNLREFLPGFPIRNTFLEIIHF